jgi:hypothetical protein
VARKNPEAEAPGLFLWIWVAYSLVYAFFAVNMRVSVRSYQGARTWCRPESVMANLDSG